MYSRYGPNGGASCKTTLSTLITFICTFVFGIDVYRRLRPTYSTYLEIYKDMHCIHREKGIATLIDIKNRMSSSQIKPLQTRLKDLRSTWVVRIIGTFFIFVLQEINLISSQRS